MPSPVLTPQLTPVPTPQLTLCEVHVYIHNRVHFRILLKSSAKSLGWGMSIYMYYKLTEEQANYLWGGGGNQSLGGPQK